VKQGWKGDLNRRIRNYMGGPRPSMKDYQTPTFKDIGPRCPKEKRHGKDLIGCGSANLDGPDAEGFYDCRDCGLWFKEEVKP